MKKVPKETTDDALIQEFLNKGGKVSIGKTKPLAAELGLSNNAWNNKLTKEEKAARDKKWISCVLGFSFEIRGFVSAIVSLFHAIGFDDRLVKPRDMMP
jgi:hypothetical protein